MPAQFTKHFVQDLTQDIKIRQCGTIVFNADNLSNVISVDLYNGQEEYSGGGTVAGAVICPDGATVALTGSIDGKTASVTLTADCFAIPGQIGVGVQVISESVRTTILKAIYNVELLSTDNMVDPDSRITASVTQLVADIEAATAEIPASDMASLMSGIAPTFSASTAYPAGAYVYYNGTLYRFASDHAAGSWTGTDATAVALGNDVADLKSAFVEDVYQITGAKPVIFESGAYQIPNIGGTVVSEASEYVVRAKIAVTPGEIVTIFGGASSGVYRLYGFENSNGEVISRANANLDGLFKVTVPANAVYMYIQNFLTVKASGYYVYVNTALIDIVNAEKSKTSELMETVNGNISVDNFDPMLKSAFSYKYQSVELTLTSGYYMAIDGTLTENASSKYGSVSVTQGDHYRLVTNHGAAMKAYVLIDANNNVVDYYPQTQVSAQTETIDFKIEESGTLYVNSYGSATLSIATGVSTKDGSVQQSMALFGDSWSDANSVLSAKKWCDYIAEDMGISLANFASSGTGYKNGTSSYFGKRINDKLPSGYTEIVAIFGSGNDCQYMSGSAGTSSDIFDPVGGTGDTVGGRINYAFSVLKTKAPLAKVIIFSPCPWQIYPPATSGNDMELYVTLLKECCLKAGFIFVDMYHNSGLRPWDDTQAALWAEQSPTNRVHPNTEGQYFLYPQMCDEMRRIVPKVNKYSGN